MTRIATIGIGGVGLLRRDAAARDLQEVLNTGTLRVGVTLYAPWAARGADGELVGFEVDVARQLAADMGVEAQIFPYDLDRLVPALESGEIDLIAAGLTITPERALHVNFSAAVRRERRRPRDARREHGERHGRHGARQRSVHDRGRRRLGRRGARAAPVAARARPRLRIRRGRERSAARRRSARLRRGRARADVPGARQPRRHRRADGAAAAREPGGIRGQQGRRRLSRVLERMDHGARGRHVAADDGELLVRVAALARAARQ